MMPSEKSEPTASVVTSTTSDPVITTTKNGPTTTTSNSDLAETEPMDVTPNLPKETPQNNVHRDNATESVPPPCKKSKTPEDLQHSSQGEPIQARKPVLVKCVKQSQVVFEDSDEDEGFLKAVDELEVSLTETQNEGATKLSQNSQNDSQEINFNRKRARNMRI
jgi:hypothetical protein